MKKGPKSVDVIGMDKVPFEKILGADIGKAIQKVRLVIQSNMRHIELNRMAALVELGRAGHQIPHGGRCRQDLA